MTTIADRVQEMHKGMADQPPNEAMAAFGAEQKRLAAAGQPADLIEVGTTLADVDLLDVDGAATTLYGVASGPTGVVLYRGAWCPYCNLTLNTYQSELVPHLADRGVGLVAVSPQHPDGSLTMRDKNSLTYDVVSDPGNKVARAVGVLIRPADDVRAAQLQLGLDLEAINADGTTGIPLPTTLILDAEHIVRWVDVHPDYSTRSEPADILAALSAAGF